MNAGDTSPRSRLSRVSAESPSPNRRVLGDTIALHNAQASDSAVYQCEASNRHGTLLSNANIMIMSKCEDPWSPSLSDRWLESAVAVSHKAARSRGRSAAHALRPCRATRPVPGAIYMLTSFPSIPYGNQGHKTNMCCFTSADKNDGMLLFSCSAHIWGVFCL